MATTSVRTTVVGFSGEVDATFQFEAGSNAVSPGAIDILTLAAGANTITPPAGGSTPVAATIIPPSGNTQSLILKGVTGDTGVRLHDTDPTTIALDPSVSTFVLTAGGTITGLRIVWS